MVRKEIMETYQIFLGNRIKLVNIESQKQETYQIVPKAEFTNRDPDAVSAHSPIGKALIGKRINDIIEIRIPSGTVNYKVLDIYWFERNKLLEWFGGLVVFNFNYTYNKALN